MTDLFHRYEDCHGAGTSTCLLSPPLAEAGGNKASSDGGAGVVIVLLIILAVIAALCSARQTCKRCGYTGWRSEFTAHGGRCPRSGCHSLQ
jgi:hypothetical protein